jgi:tetratricopeptide (TPR) repeat protein
LAPACSVPLFDPSTPAPRRTVEELLQGGHYLRTLTELTAEPPPVEDAAGVARHNYLLSRAELGLGRLEHALELAEQAVGAEPDNAAYHVQVAAAAGRMAEHAAMFKQLSLAKRAKKELDAAVALDSRNADGLYGLILFSDMAPSFIGGDKTRAQKLAEQLTEIDPGRGYLAQAALAHNRHDTVAEGALLRKAVAADPANYDAHMALAVYVKKAEPENKDVVDEEACAAVTADPSRGEAWSLLVENAAAAECWREVHGLVTMSKRFNPDDPSPAFQAAVTMIGMGKNLDEAQALLKDYLEKPHEGGTPSTGSARFHLASALEKQGRRDEAIVLLQMAIEEDPTLADARRDIHEMPACSPLRGIENTCEHAELIS